mgnify:CR=1 FL=1
MVYVLEALEAYNQRLVKKIEVKGFEVKNFRGTDGYLYLEQIVLSSKKPPMANTLVPVQDSLKHMEKGIHKLIQAIYAESAVQDMLGQKNTFSALQKQKVRWTA